MKYLKEYRNYTSPEEQRINDILDKMNSTGEEPTSQEKELMLNDGKESNKKYIGIPDQMEFELEEIEDYSTELRAVGKLEYNGKEYLGHFILPTGEDQGKNTWQFFSSETEFEPNEDDFHEFDSMIHEIEIDVVG